MSLKIYETACKHALSHSGIYGWEYVINPYRGCSHSCVYCYAPNIIKAPRSEWGNFVEVRKNIPNILAKELKRHIKGLTGISSVTDPYQKIEEKYNLTRYCLEQLLRYQFPVSIITKSPLIIRDIDLFTKFDHVEVTVSITTLDENVAKLLEPMAPSIKSRLKALNVMSNENLNTYAFLGPLLPVLELDEVAEFMEKIFSTGVKTVMVDSLNLKRGIWSSIEKKISDDSELKIKFQNRLFQDKKYYQNITEMIKQECIKNNVQFD
jgi:DNA repair photolyase